MLVELSQVSCKHGNAVLSKLWNIGGSSPNHHGHPIEGRYHVIGDKQIKVDYTGSGYNHLVNSLLQTANEATSRLAVFLHIICCDGMTAGMAAQSQAGTTSTFDSHEGALATCMRSDSPLEFLSEVCFLCSRSMSLFIDSSKSAQHLAGVKACYSLLSAL